MLNKPAGTVSATEDGKYPTVVSLIWIRFCERICSPVGRLDLDTEGLLLITNDGAMAHELLSPKKHVDKDLSGLHRGNASKGMQKADAGRPCNRRRCKDTSCRTGDIRPAGRHERGTYSSLFAIHEGKFHQVKRMFEVLGCKVVYLKRVTMDRWKLDPSQSRRVPDFKRRRTEELERKIK